MEVPVYCTFPESQSPVLQSFSSGQITLVFANSRVEVPGRYGSEVSLAVSFQVCISYKKFSSGSHVYDCHSLHCFLRTSSNLECSLSRGDLIFQKQLLVIRNPNQGMIIGEVRAR